MSASSKRAIEAPEARPAGARPGRPGQARGAREHPGRHGGEVRLGEVLPKGSDGCRDETELKAVLAASRNYDELLDAWQGWHDAARPLRADYVRFVELANEGASELGYQDLGAMWRSAYDMPADDFTREASALWGQVQPFYEQLHCYTRTARPEIRRGQGPGRQAHPGAPARQPVGTGVGHRLRPARAVSGREQPRRRLRPQDPGLRCGAHDAGPRRRSTSRSRSRRCRRPSGSARCW